MWAIRSQTRLLYPNSLSYLFGNIKINKTDSIVTDNRHLDLKAIHDEGVPWDQLDKVVIEGDASASIEDGGVTVAVEVCGDNLQGSEQMPYSWEKLMNKTKDLRKGTSAYLVLRVSQNSLHGPISCSLHHLLNVVVFGLLQRKEIVFSKKVWCYLTFYSFFKENSMNKLKISISRTLKTSSLRHSQVFPGGLSGQPLTRWGWGHGRPCRSTCCGIQTFGR